MKKKIDNRRTVTKLSNAIERQEINTKDDAIKFLQEIIERTNYGAIRLEEASITKSECVIVDYPKSNIIVTLESYSEDGNFDDECDSINVTWMAENGEIMYNEDFG